jgi:hypothetical protein
MTSETPLPQGEGTVYSFYLLNTMAFNLQEAQSCSEIPACRAPEVLALLIEVNPIQEPELQRYPARVNKFCSNFVIRKIMGDITVPFVEAVVDRMFNADEVTSVVDLVKVECLKRKIVSLFFTQRELL